MIPRAEELVSDEDSEEEEDTEGVGMNINHLGEGMLRQQCELVMIGCVDDAEEPDIQVINDAGEVVAEKQEIDPVPGPSGNKRRQTSREEEDQDEQQEAEPVPGPSGNKRSRTNGEEEDQDKQQEAEPVAGPSGNKRRRTSREEEDQDEQQEAELVPGSSGNKRRRTSGLPAAVAAKEVPFTQLGRLKNKERMWSRNTPAQFSENIPPFQPVAPSKSVSEDILLPYDFWRLFISDEFMDKLSTKSMLYSTRKGCMEKATLLTKDNLLTSMALMYLSGYNTPAQKELWWENRPDTQNMYVKKAMTRDTFRAVARFTYFTDPEDQDLSDPFWKVRPLFDELNLTAKQYIQQSEFVAVDESMVRYFGPQPLKRAIREKPER